MHLTLCEYASNHRDGTFTIVRGGIEFFEIFALPHDALIWLFVEMPPNALPEGGSGIIIELYGPAGEVNSKAEGLIVSPRPDQPSRYGIPFNGQFRAFGKWSVSVRVGTSQATLAFDVRPVAPVQQPLP